MPQQIDTTQIFNTFAKDVLKDIPKEEIVGEVPDKKEGEDIVDAFNEVAKNEEPKEGLDESKTDKKEVEKKVPESKEPTKEEPKVEPIEDTSNARDYSGLEESEVGMFKKMSNESFLKLKPMYLEHKQLKVETEKLNEQVKIYQERNPALDFHPQAFILNPEFQKKSFEIQGINEELGYWKDSLEEMNGGRSGVNLIRGHDGKLINGGELAPTPKNVQYVIERITDLSTNSRMLQGEVRTIQEGHKKNVEEASAGLKDYEEKMFPMFKDKGYQDKFSQVSKSVPPVFHANPMTSILVKSFIMINELLNERNAQLKSKSSKVEEDKAGLTNKEVKQVPKDKVETNQVSYNDFSKFL